MLLLSVLIVPIDCRGVASYWSSTRLVYLLRTVSPNRVCLGYFCWWSLPIRGRYRGQIKTTFSVHNTDSRKALIALPLNGAVFTVIACWNGCYSTRFLRGLRRWHIIVRILPGSTAKISWNNSTRSLMILLATRWPLLFPGRALLPWSLIIHVV